jgi:Transposase
MVEHFSIRVSRASSGSTRRVPEGLAGLGLVHELLAGQVEDPAEVVVGTETDRGLFVGALVAAGYQVYAVNPLAVSRYRDRHQTSGAKSDAGDAKVLADLVRTDRHNHRPVAGDSESAEAVKVLARTHQSLVWTRQRQLNQLRSLLREVYPAPWPPSVATWAAATPWPCSRWRRPRSWAASCRGPSWPRPCAGPVVSAGWRAAPPSCRPSWANRSWSPPR